MILLSENFLQEINMGIEIERKFLLKEKNWRPAEPGKKYRQGYLSLAPERSVRVRIVEDRGYLTIKGISRGAARLEYQYEIPAVDAEAMLDELCEKPLIEKVRYVIKYEGLIWEVDRFLAENEGLIIAEVELGSENQLLRKPEWIGKEVTEDPKYYNVNLIKHPYSQWRNRK
jgi:CYTH domain-containing protein